MYKNYVKEMSHVLRNIKKSLLNQFILFNQFMHYIYYAIENKTQHAIMKYFYHNCFILYGTH